MILQLSFHRSHDQALKTASKQWCNFAPLRKVSATETFSYGTTGFVDHSHRVVQGAAESLKCCTCSLEGAVCIPLHTSSGFSSQVVCYNVCAAACAAKQKASSTGRDTNTHSLSYNTIHMLPPLLYYIMCATIEAHRARLARIKKRFRALLWMQRIHRGISFLREGCSVYKSLRHCTISPLGLCTSLLRVAK